MKVAIQLYEAEYLLIHFDDTYTLKYKPLTRKLCTGTQSNLHLLPRFSSSSVHSMMIWPTPSRP